jgi:hypothetical protein
MFRALEPSTDTLYFFIPHYPTNSAPTDIVNIVTNIPFGVCRPWLTKTTLMVVKERCYIHAFSITLSTASAVTSVGHKFGRIYPATW